MKTNPENNLPPSTTEGSRAKKILLFTTYDKFDPLLMRKIESGNHLVMETVTDPDLLIHEIARTTPHLLIVHTSVKSDISNLVRERIHVLFPELPICLLRGCLSKGDALWQDTLKISLNQPLNPQTPRAYADNQRVVCHDVSLHALWQGKLNRPKQTPGWEHICSQQEARFIVQLQTGRKNHGIAKHYFACLQQQQLGLDQELTYRLVHGSYKALCWSRDLAIKWLALLAHYVPDVELQFLQVAGTPGPAIDYVHHDTRIEGVYAATMLLQGKVKPTIENAVTELVTTRFDQQDDNSLLALSLKIYGLAKMLEQVAMAQIALMDAWLNPAIVDKTGEADVPRGEQRNAGIYRDFYDLTFIVNSPEPLASILRGFHAGTTRVEHGRMFPTFAEFRQICRRVNP